MDTKSESVLVTVKEGAGLPTFSKTIGKTTYEVTVHFSTTSTETMNEKVMRLIQSDCEKTGK